MGGSDAHSGHSEEPGVTPGPGVVPHPSTPLPSGAVELSDEASECFGLSLKHEPAVGPSNQPPTAV